MTRWSALLLQVRREAEESLLLGCSSGARFRGASLAVSPAWEQPPSLLASPTGQVPVCHTSTPGPLGQSIPLCAPQAMSNWGSCVLRNRDHRILAALSRGLPCQSYTASSLMLCPVGRRGRPVMQFALSPTQICPIRRDNPFLCASAVGSALVNSSSFPSIPALLFSPHSFLFSSFFATTALDLPPVTRFWTLYRRYYYTS